MIDPAIGVLHAPAGSDGAVATGLEILRDPARQRVLHQGQPGWPVHRSRDVFQEHHFAA